MIDMFKHLLPRARAWSIIVDKQLRQFFEGLSGTITDVKAFFDGVFEDIFPDTTQELDAWESQFGLVASADLTEQERRDRLTAAWQATGGQSPRYIQDTLQANGFDVYVHEWWVPGSEADVGVSAAATPRDPFTYLKPSQESTALLPVGYPLVNKILTSVPNEVTLCGEAVAECGEELAECGNFIDFRYDFLDYEIPVDPATWPYFLYIGGETFPDTASVLLTRKDEFETLCLKICPAQQWLGILVEYNGATSEGAMVYNGDPMVYNGDPMVYNPPEVPDNALTVGGNALTVGGDFLINTP